MEVITIVVAERHMDVVDGRVKKSRLKYSSAGLEINVFGRISAGRYDAINYLAMSECLARHIPLASLVSYGWV